MFTPASVDDDLVSVSTKDFCVYFTISICFWLFSFVLISMQIFEHGHFISPNVLLFLPMWFGSLGGIVSAVLIVYRIGNTMIVSRERRLLMRAQGYEYGGRMIEQESLPLLRMLIGWSAIAVVSFLLAFISQVLFYLWFIQRGIGIWHALVPTCIMIVIYLAFVYTVEFFSRVSCTVISLLSLELVIKCNAIVYLPLLSLSLLFLIPCISFTFPFYHTSYTYIIQVLFALKVDNGLSYLGWDVVSIPAIVVLLVAYRYLSELLYSLWVTDYYQFSALQVRCLGMYTVALVLVSVALVLSVCSSVERPFHQHIDHHKDMTAVLKALASVLFVDGAPGVDEPPREEDIDIDRGDIGGGEIDRGEIGSIDVDAVKDDPFPDPSIESYSYSLDPSVPSLDPVPLLLWTIAMVLMTAASLMIFNDEVKKHLLPISQCIAYILYHRILLYISHLPPTLLPSYPRTSRLLPAYPSHTPPILLPYSTR